jgi:hypothetical protein
MIFARLLPALAATALFLSGCATKFSPKAYFPESEGHVKIASSRQIVVYPSFDHIAPEERQNDDPKFNPAGYLESMIETELAESALSFKVADFATGNGFDELGATLASSKVVSEGAVVLASSIETFPNPFVMSCNVKLFDNKGRVLFEKRGISLIFSVLNPEALKHCRDFMYTGKSANIATPEEKRLHDMRAAQMAMRQIFNDPDFRKALQ